ncbi:MAG: signal transduction histidine kinase, LytS [Frankiales bacterium]|nr:signal transduction histidine kinase, LytS [Frankiales bacterium]
MVRLGRRARGASEDRAAYSTLHTAALAAPSLREGLTATAAAKSSRYLRDLLGTPAIALCDATSVLAWDGPSGAPQRAHEDASLAHAQQTIRTRRTGILYADSVACFDQQCPLRAAVIAPIVTEERVVAALVAYDTHISPGLVRATEEVASWVSGQVELAELGRQRTRAMEAELRALRAQISPHFVYNSLAAIASFVRTDPERARGLLLEFADYSRYALRHGGEFTTLADELRNVERYLVLEQARFGDRLRVSLTVAPELLPVAIPFLVIQPLVENAVRHGLAGCESGGSVTIVANDHGQDAEISVEDDGIGSDPEVVRLALSGESERDSVGLGNVDARLRQVYGDRHGLVVETALGAGTKVSFRVPKYAAGVRASS